MIDKTRDNNDMTDETDRKSFKDAAIDELSFFVKLFLFLFVFFTFGFGHYKIPSESMQPTLEVGDHLYTSKFAYGYSRHSLPWGAHKLPLPDGQILSRLPKRGDVVVFRNPNTNIVMIKRAVGLPGDELIISNGRLYINGAEIGRDLVETRTFRPDRGARGLFNTITGRKQSHVRWEDPVTVNVYQEVLPNEKKAHMIYERSDQERLDNTRLFTVPAGTVFMMGDNRDNSLDSRDILDYRSPGFVPQDHLIGRADMMMFSFKRCPKDDDSYCPPRRFLKSL